MVAQEGIPGIILVGLEGIEPSLPCGNYLLRVARLPLRHNPVEFYMFKSLVCNFCKKSFERSIKAINQSKKRKRKATYCGNECSLKARIPKTLKKCKFCKINIPFQKGYAPKKFCTRSCAAKFNNMNKAYGFRRSKLEYAFEEFLRNNFPLLNIECNNRILLNGLELDFYFPEKQLAIEFNGVTHNKPIYGKKKFNKIKKNDNLKITMCNNLGINLIVIAITDKTTVVDCFEYIKYYL